MDKDLSLLSSRPSWSLTSLLKWLTLVLVAAYVLSVAVAFWAMWEAEKLFAINYENDDYVNPFDWGYNLSDTTLDLLWLILTAGTLWVLATAAEKLDQLVWLAASDDDRAEIYARRKRLETK